MNYKKFAKMVVLLSLFAFSVYGQTVVTILPYNGTAETYVNAQIVADTTTAGGLTNRIYELARDQYFLANAIFTVPAEIHCISSPNVAAETVIYLWNGNGSAHATPGYFLYGMLQPIMGISACRIL
jgi:hypothetical protein